MPRYCNRRSFNLCCLNLCTRDCRPSHAPSQATARNIPIEESDACGHRTCICKRSAQDAGEMMQGIGIAMKARDSDLLVILQAGPGPIGIEIFQ